MKPRAVGRGSASDPSSLADQINQLGAEMVACKQSCAGVACDPSAGVLPRCLFLESAGRTEAFGAAIVGLNPGRCTSEERRFYLETGASFGSVTAWFVERSGREHQYYKLLRKFVDSLGLSGPILWTELAKCENDQHTNGLLPLQTYRTCTRRFLQRELDLIPKKWPLIGVGVESYKALAYRFPDRTVIGVPHPTGSRGHFSKLFGRGSLVIEVMRKANAALDSPGSVIWLASAKSSA